jgi:hypothetical protein
MRGRSAVDDLEEKTVGLEESLFYKLDLMITDLKEFN